MSKKTILFFGDSLTFCFDAESNDRHRYENRWTSLVEEKFNGKFRFIVEGQVGRTVDNDDGTEGKNGLKTFTQALYSHLYLDYIFIMLGTNELKENFRTDAETTANKFIKYKTVLEKWGVDWEETTFPKIILVAPPRINENFLPPGWGHRGSEHISSKIAEELGWDFLDASDIPVSEKDGVHLDFEGNKRLAAKIIDYIGRNSD
jgi:lysophospholipase L1-like esterase